MGFAKRIKRAKALLMSNKIPPARKILATSAFFALLMMAGACSPQIDHRGYLAKAGDLQKIQYGMSKSEVQGLLGSPSTKATIKYTGDSYYYISSTVEQRGFLDPREVDRKILAIRFDQNDQVQSFAHYGLQDGRIVNINTRKTPTRGRELTILQQLFSSLGAGNLVGEPGGFGGNRPGQ